MRHAAPLFFLLSLLTTAAIATDQPPVGHPWLTDWDDAFAKAKAEKKFVFVDFFADWCGPCRKMESEVFPDPAVQQQFADFVLLRVNFDEGFTARAKKVRLLPTYVVYDPHGHERVRFFGGMPAPKFVQAMKELRSAAPSFLHGSTMIEDGKAAEGWTHVGNAYMRLQMAEKARGAYDSAIKAARSSNDPATGKVASAQRAFTWTVEGKPEKTVKELRTISSTTVSPDSDALAWILAGRAAEKAKDLSAARDAYSRALAIAPGEPLLTQAKTALERIPQ